MRMQMIISDYHLRMITIKLSEVQQNGKLT